MANELNETLSRVAEDVFESLAFVLPAFEEEPSAAPEAEDRTAATISFAGPFEGTLALSASNELLPTIAANMLGLDYGESASPEIEQDAFKELMNVICGNLLPAIAGQEVIFDVAPAQLLADGAVPVTVAGYPPLATAQLHMEEGWVDVVLFAPQHLAAEPEVTV